MAYPTDPEITYSFTGFSQSLGDGSFPGPEMDDALMRLIASADEANAFLRGSFRSDGVLKVSALPTGADFQTQIDLATGAAVIAEEARDDAAISAAQSLSNRNAAGASESAAAGSATAAAGYAASINPSLLMARASNLSDVVNQATARTNLGLGPLATLNTVGMTQLSAEILANLLPTGSISHFARSTSPAGWVKANGQTIGGPSSGAALTGLDYQALFSLLWTEFTDAVLPVQTSTGAASTRGASAAADWAANKRLVLPDLRGEFLRGLDDGRGVDTSRVIGAAQGGLVAAHTHDVTGTAASNGAHQHNTGVRLSDAAEAVYGTVTVASGIRFGTSTNNVTLGAVTNSSGAHTHTVSGTAAANVGAENRPRNVAFLTCIKL